MAQAVDEGTGFELLLIEPDAEVAGRLRKALSETRGSHRFHTVANVQDATIRLRANPPDVVILDLPRGGDENALRRLRDSSPDLPVIVLTGPADREAFLAGDRDSEDYLTDAALDPRILGSSIRHAVQRNRERRRLADVTRELQEANARFERLALIDPLTELLNRRGLQKVLTELIEAIRHSPAPVAVLLVDVDDFKLVNDRLGHAGGDVALREIARRLRAGVRASDHVSRIGGDEFLLLLPQADPAELFRISERIRTAVSSVALRSVDGPVPVGASIGALMLTPDLASIDLIVATAQLLLRRSKSAGKNRVTSNGSETDPADERELLCDAICRGEGLFALSQPIVRFADGTFTGYELLSRFSHPEIQLPGSFFAACAERNLLTLADHQCFRACLERATTLPRSAAKHINLFPSTLLGVPAEHLLNDIRARFDPSSVCIELSESQILGDPAHLIEPIEQLRRGGVRIGLDDVGFGNTSIESLLLLEPDVIKLDKRVVRGISGDETGRHRLGRLAEIARDIATLVVAEGIQSQEDLDIARGMGIRFGQGYFWGRPA